MLRCDDLGRLLPQKKLQKNDTVRILKGPFSDFLAKVVSTDANQRIWILMDIMGRKTRLQINSNKLHLQI
jgi:transcriptional antiterminator RfaH